MKFTNPIAGLMAAMALTQTCLAAQPTGTCSYLQTAHLKGMEAAMLGGTQHVNLLMKVDFDNLTADVFSQKVRNYGTSSATAFIQKMKFHFTIEDSEIADIYKLSLYMDEA